MKNLKVILVVVALHITINSFAQQQNWNWYFGQNCAINFSTGIPVSVAGSAMSTNEGTASISDAGGNLLFYTDGMSVWDRTNALMPHGNGLHGGSSSTQSALIVPKPNNPNQYYLFTNDGQSYGVYYYTVDMTLHAGLGDVVSNTGTGILTNSTEKLTAVRHNNGTDYWVLSHSLNTNTYYAWLVNSAGVHAPVVSNAGTINSSVIGYLKVAPNGLRIADAHFDNSNVDVLDFNNATGTVSNTNVINIPAPLEYAYGVSFSPNIQVLYEVGDNSPAHLMQWDLSSNNQATIIASQDTIATLNYSGGALQLGIDGRLYIAHHSSQFLDIIYFPNVLGAGCNYVDSAVNLGAGTCMIGLPNDINAYGNFSITSGVYTITDTTIAITCGSPGTASVNSITGGTSPYNYLWNTGATTSSISVATAGIYSVTITDAAKDTGTFMMYVNTTVVNPNNAVEQLCIVTVDSATQKNKLIWNKTYNAHIGNYHIFKETTSAGVYALLANQPFSTFSTYIDNSSQPQVVAARYKLVTLDTCGTPSDSGIAHKTIHLSVNQGTGNTWNLIWDAYEGISFSTYYILRGTTPTNIVLLDSVQNTLYSYTDLNPPNGNVYYAIEVGGGTACNPSIAPPHHDGSHSKSLNGAISRSNVKDATTNVIELNTAKDINVIIDAMNNMLNIDISKSSLSTVNGQISIVDILGRAVIKQDIKTLKTSIDIAPLSKAMYFYQIKVGDVIKRGKLILTK